MHKALFSLLIAASLLLSGQVSGAATPVPAGDLPAELLDQAVVDDGALVSEVKLDGATLFRLRGISAFPAKERARRIQRLIIKLAEDPTVDPDVGEISKTPNGIQLTIDGQAVVTLLSADAALESVPLDVLGEVTLERLKYAIQRYREARSPDRLLASTGVLLAITVMAGLVLWAFNALFRWLNERVERVVKRRIEKIERASHRLVDAAQLWRMLGGLLGWVRIIGLFVIVLTWLNTSLGLYPWTRPFATNVFRLLLAPLERMGRGVMESVPDLIFLAILTVVVRFLLKALKTFFVRVDRGWLRLQNFERDWAMPTYRIFRILIIAFGLVIAYPYIPGSDSEAFKGVSIFLGVVFSIGSSSFIANMIAGYSLTYRGAFREGDRVRIGEHVGDVIDVRALSTRLRSLKNEEINIPNSEILASAVINYSTYQRDGGLILHTDVGIGYDVPWRQVEAMLLLAAARTEGVAESPKPFVLQTGLGDFTVTYQLNAHCPKTANMTATYSALHANIQDVFNEHGVQIMSPNYVADPDSPKTVPPADWYTAPASPPEE